MDTPGIILQPSIVSHNGETYVKTSTYTSGKLTATSVLGETMSVEQFLEDAAAVGVKLVLYLVVLLQETPI